MEVLDILLRVPDALPDVLHRAGSVASAFRLGRVRSLGVGVVRVGVGVDRRSAPARDLGVAQNAGDLLLAFDLAEELHAVLVHRVELRVLFGREIALLGPRLGGELAHLFAELPALLAQFLDLIPCVGHGASVGGRRRLAETAKAATDPGSWT
ncbi:MAG: hypothetical protein ABI639_16210 [Thermoanaerobaculia bacterium]